jgi:hypothetical protein
MRYMKFLRSLAVAIAATVALGGSASADYLSTTTDGVAATPVIHALNENGHLALHNPEMQLECASTFDGTVQTHGVGQIISVQLSSMSFTGCTGGWTIAVNSPGWLSAIHTTEHSGKVTSSGLTATATLNLVFFHITCRYATSSTNLGTLTGGTPATLDIEGKLPFHSGSAACGEEPSQWTGDYVLTGALYIADS